MDLHSEKRRIKQTYFSDTKNLITQLIYSINKVAIYIKYCSFEKASTISTYIENKFENHILFREEPQDFTSIKTVFEDIEEGINISLEDIAQYFTQSFDKICEDQTLYNKRWSKLTYLINFLISLRTKDMLAPMSLHSIALFGVNLITRLKFKVLTELNYSRLSSPVEIINNNPESKDLAIKRNNIFCILVEQLIILHRTKAHCKNLLLCETQNLRAGAIYIPH